MDNVVLITTIAAGWMFAASALAIVLGRAIALRDQLDG